MDDRMIGSKSQKTNVKDFVDNESRTGGGKGNKKETENVQFMNVGKLWHNFRILTPTSAVLHGSCSMNDKRFKFQSRGEQGTACSIVAFIFGHLCKLSDWSQDLVDQVLENGDKLFRTSQTRNHLKPGMYMKAEFICPEFYVGDYKCKIEVEKNNYQGYLFGENLGCLSFAEGLKNFFDNSKFGVVTAQAISVAMWKPEEGGFMYFDAGPCAENGMRCLEGTACVIRFKYMNHMCDLFLSNMNRKYNSKFCIDKVKVLYVNLINRDKVTCDNFEDKLQQIMKSCKSYVDGKRIKLNCTWPVPKVEKLAPTMVSEIKRIPLNITISNYSIGAKLASDQIVDQTIADTGYTYYDMHVNVPSTFKELPGNIAILHGWTHEGSDIYKGKGAQNVANCVMAIMMRKVHAVESWLRPKLDEILVLGDIAYARAKAESPSLKTVTATDLNDMKFKIDDKNLIVDVDLLTVMGTINSRIPTVLNLKQALEEFFLVNSDGVIETSSMAIAVWKSNGTYYMFDPRQCDISGIRVSDTKGKSATSKKKDNVVEDKQKVLGKCCVVRFPDINSLVALYLKNIDPKKKNDFFIIRHVTPVDDIPGTRVWNEFQPGDKGKTWILRGNIANDNESFEEESRGVQGVAISIVALVSAKEIPPSKWTRNDVDEAVQEGDSYYNWCIPMEQEENRKLSVFNLKKDLYVKNRKVRIDVEDSVITGNVVSSTVKDTSNLEKGILNFFEDYQYGIIEIGDVSFAVWKFEEEAKDKSKEMAYYLFDPNPRNRLGLATLEEGEEGELVACVLRSLDPKELANVIQKNLDTEDEPESESNVNDFQIHKVNIVSSGEVMTDEEIEKDKMTAVKPDLLNYTSITDEIAGLFGSFSQNDTDKFSQQTRDKQQAANAIVTLAMTKLYNPHLWFTDVLDDILKIGNKLTIDNLKNLPEPEESERLPRSYLLPTEIDEDFLIGVNRMSITLEEENATGGVNDLIQILETFFESNTMGIFIQDDVAIPIWKEGNTFFMMDPRGRDNRGQPNEEHGTAAVFWSTSIPALVTMLKLSARQSGGQFIIDAVTIETIYETRVADNQRTPKIGPGDDLWYNFPKKSDGVWAIRGNVSMTNEKFEEENRGKQSAAIAAMTTVFFKVYQPQQWTSDILDEVVVSGNKLHSKSIARLGSEKLLQVNEIIPEFFLANRRVSFSIVDCVQAGGLTSKYPNMQDLQNGIDAFFEDHDTGILTVNDINNVAIFKSEGFYYCTLPDYEIMRFASTTLLVAEVISRYGVEGDYEINAVDVNVSSIAPPWKYDPSSAIRLSDLPPLNAFHKLKKPARAILRGSIHQGSDIFADGIRNKQTAANCVVALGMSVIKNPVTWTKKILDEILLTGNSVHRETMKVNVGKERFRPAEIVRIFKLGVNVLTADVEDATISGQVAIPPPEPETKTGKKGQAKKKPQANKQTKGKKGKTKREPTPPSPPILLEEGLRKFLKDNNAGVLMVRRSMCAIWKDLGVYFMYDPRSRNEEGLQSDDGVSCVMWFACLEPLIDLIYANIDESEKYHAYDICRTVVKRVAIEELPCPTGFESYSDCVVSPVPMSVMKKVPTLNVKINAHFCQVDENFSILRGTIHMRDHSFSAENRGHQSTAIAVVTIVVALLHAPSTWTPALIDAIIKYGDILHVDSARAVRTSCRNLSPCEILTTFVVADFQARIHVDRHTMAGILYVQDLEQSLLLFFRKNCSAILHTSSLTVAVMQYYGKFYLFDPNSRNELGKFAYDGTACIFKCESIEKLVTIFIANCNYKNPPVYTLNAVNVLNLHFFSDVETKCPTVCGK